MEIINQLIGYFSSADNTTKAMMAWGALVGVVASLRTLLVIVAPMTKTKLDDKAAGIFTKIYNVSSKLTNHGQNQIKK